MKFFTGGQESFPSASVKSGAPLKFRGGDGCQLVELQPKCGPVPELYLTDDGDTHCTSSTLSIPSHNGRIRN